MSWQLIPAPQLVHAIEGTAWTNNPPWMNVTFQRRPPGAHDLRGPGIYAFFLDGQLLYIGIYAGRKTQVYGGSVLDDRWLKHVGVITLRGKKLSLRDKTLAQLRGGPGSAIVEGILAAGGNLLRSQGMEASLRKIRFLTENWAPLNLGAPIGDLFGRLTIGYVQMPPGGTFGKAPKPVVKAFLESVETALVIALSPPLNTRSLHARFGGNPPGVVMPIIHSLLSARVSSAADPMQPDPGPADLPPDEPAEPSEVFDELLSASATAFIAELTRQVEASGALMLYYTFDGGQVRLARPVEPGERRRPLLVLDWRSTQNVFLCKCRTVVSQLPPGLHGKTTSDKAMDSEFRIAPDVARIPDLLAVCV